jgi:hypothetical protein
MSDSLQDMQFTDPYRYDEFMAEAENTKYDDGMTDDEFAAELKKITNQETSSETL